MFSVDLSVDKCLFEKRTGVSFYSEKGEFFRRMAINNLDLLYSDTLKKSCSNKELAHRLKGIASTCGVQKAAYICNKCEQYDDLLDKGRIALILRFISKDISLHLKI